MVRSMTGYGASKGASGRMEIAVEIRSVNNRFLDLAIRLPRAYAAVEDTLRQMAARTVSRGKVDVFVALDASGDEEVAVRPNRALACAYLDAIREISACCGLECDLTALDIARLPDVLAVERAEQPAEALAEDIARVMAAALSDFDAMRSREGARLAADISARLDEIERLVQRIEERSPRSVEEYRSRLEARLREVLQGVQVDETRLLMEAAIVAERSDVNEEVVRLRSHIAQLRALLEAGGPIGRKMDFLVQELNREANTIGSKALDAEIARLVVDVKAEIEKVREQAQNIE